MHKKAWMEETLKSANIQSSYKTVVKHLKWQWSTHKLTAPSLPISYIFSSLFYFVKENFHSCHSMTFMKSYHHRRIIHEYSHCILSEWVAFSYVYMKSSKRKNKWGYHPSFFSSHIEWVNFLISSWENCLRTRLLFILLSDKEHWADHCDSWADYRWRGRSRGREYPYGNCDAPQWTSTALCRASWW